MKNTLSTSITSSILRPVLAGALFGATLLGGITPVSAQPNVIALPTTPVPARPFEGIVVTGTGEVRVRPDIARLNLGVQTQDRDPQRAAQLNATRTQEVIAALRRAGIAEADIQTAGYSITPQYDYRQRPVEGGREPVEPPQPILTGYQVNNEVRVTVRRIDNAGRVLDAGIKAGANTAGGISFDLDNRTPVRDEALRQAAQDAARKARVLAEATSASGPVRVVTPLRLVALVENGVDAPPRPFYEMARADVAQSSTPVAPGEILISASVTAYYSTGAR